MPDFGHFSTIFSILLKFAIIDPKMATKWLFFQPATLFLPSKNGLKL